MEFNKMSHLAKGSTLYSLTIKSVLVLIFAVSCNPPKDRIKPKIPDANKAPENIENSFQVEVETKFPKAVATSKNFHIKILKTSLNKLFLMAPSLVDFYLAPRVVHLKPKVVSFGIYDDKLAMFEVDSRIIYQDIASNKLIQTFPIKKETDTYIEFDMNLGFTNITVHEGLGLAELPSSPTKKEMVMVPTQSYIESAKVENNGITIIQNSRVHSDQMMVNLINVLLGTPASIQTSESNYLIQTRLTPYKVNTKFERKITNAADMKHIGYFTTEVTAPHKGNTLSLASHWDTSEGANPITYVITKNTPEEFVQPIKEGILYWNHIFGREVIRVETGGNPQEIGSYRRNIVHWAPWDNAGFAVASLQSDPFSGEILSANVYLTSAFPMDFADRLLATIKTKSDSQSAAFVQNKSLSTIAPMGFDYDLSCSFDMSEVARGVFTQLAQPQSNIKSNNEFIKKVQKDILRLVTAHEVGHTLGLRHNFAGSLASQISDMDQLEKVFDEYIADITHKGAETTSSVMDYLSTKDDLLIGAHIQDQAIALPYDQNAIKWAYTKEAQIDYKTIPPFCSDVERIQAEVLDCDVFDSGKTPVSNIVENIKSQNKIVLFNLYEKLVEIKSALAQKEVNSINKMSLPEVLAKLPSPEAQAKKLAGDLSKLYRQFTEGAQFISLDRAFGSASYWYNKNQYQEFLLKFQSNELSKYDAQLKFNGSIVGFIAQIIPLDDNLKVKKGWFTAEVEKFINSPNFCTGTTISGMALQISAEEKMEIAKILRQFGETYEEVFLAKVLAQLAPAKSNSSSGIELSGLGLSESDASSNATYGYNTNLTLSKWEEPVSKLVEDIVLSKGAAESFKADTAESAELKKPLHSTLARINALKLASQDLFKTGNWLEASVKKMKSEEISYLNLLLKKYYTETDDLSKATLNSNAYYALVKKVSNTELKNHILKEITVLNAIEQLNRPVSPLMSSDSLLKEIKE